MKKKIVSVLLALGVIGSLSAQVFAASFPIDAPVYTTDGGDKVIEGEGFVGDGTLIDMSQPPYVDEVEVHYHYDNDGDPIDASGNKVAVEKGPDHAYDVDKVMTGHSGELQRDAQGNKTVLLTGTLITVMWPDGTYNQTEIRTGLDGKFSVDLPQHFVWEKGMVITVWQTETGKPISYPVEVVVGEGPGIVKPGPPPIDPNNILNITIPARFHWWALKSDAVYNGNTFSHIPVNGSEHMIRNNGLKIEGQTNYGDCEMTVTLKSFTHMSGKELGKDVLDLKFSGFLAGNLNGAGGGFDYNLAENYVNPNADKDSGRYAKTIKRGEEVFFSFTGRYTGKTIPTTAYTPQYQMELNFNAEYEL